MSNIIEPTVGRVVWFFDHDDHACAAMIAHVYSDRCVNLMVVNQNGEPYSETSVTLVQPGDPQPPGGSTYCTWMPYQKGQAAKTDEIGRNLAERIQAIEDHIFRNLKTE